MTVMFHVVFQWTPVNGLAQYKGAGDWKQHPLCYLFNQESVLNQAPLLNGIRLQDTNDIVGNAPLTFPLSDECLAPRLHVQTQVFHHAVDAVVQGQTAGLGLDGLSADGTLVFLFAPLLDAVAAEAVSTVQDDCL